MVYLSRFVMQNIFCSWFFGGSNFTFFQEYARFPEQQKIGKGKTKN
jgi:hypothetical protein